MCEALDEDKARFAAPCSPCMCGLRSVIMITFGLLSKVVTIFCLLSVVCCLLSVSNCLMSFVSRIFPTWPPRHAQVRLMSGTSSIVNRFIARQARRNKKS
jgi:hypothetical protein